MKKSAVITLLALTLVGASGCGGESSDAQKPSSQNAEPSQKPENTGTDETGDKTAGESTSDSSQNGKDHDGIQDQTLLSQTGTQDSPDSPEAPKSPMSPKSPESPQFPMPPISQDQGDSSAIPLPGSPLLSKGPEKTVSNPASPVASPSLGALRGTASVVDSTGTVAKTAEPKVETQTPGILGTTDTSSSATSPRKVEVAKTEEKATDGALSPHSPRTKESFSTASATSPRGGDPGLSHSESSQGSPAFVPKLGDKSLSDIESYSGSEDDQGGFKTASRGESHSDDESASASPVGSPRPNLGASLLRTEQTQTLGGESSVADLAALIGVDEIADDSSEAAGLGDLDKNLEQTLKLVDEKTADTKTEDSAPTTQALALPVSPKDSQESDLESDGESESLEQPKVVAEASAPLAKAFQALLIEMRDHKTTAHYASLKKLWNQAENARGTTTECVYDREQINIQIELNRILDEIETLPCPSNLENIFMNFTVKARRVLASNSNTFDGFIKNAPRKWFANVPKHCEDKGARRDIVKEIGMISTQIQSGK